MAEEDFLIREQNINECIEILQNILKQQVIYIEQIIVTLEELGKFLFYIVCTYVRAYFKILIPPNFRKTNQAYSACT